MPVFGSRMSPGYLVASLISKESVGYTESVDTTELQQSLTVLIHFTDAMMTECERPYLVIRAHSSHSNRPKCRRVLLSGSRLTASSKDS